jgi:hypothetical protein
MKVTERWACMVADGARLDEEHSSYRAEATGHDAQRVVATVALFHAGRCSCGAPMVGQRWTTLNDGTHTTRKMVAT